MALQFLITFVLLFVLGFGGLVLADCPYLSTKNQEKIRPIIGIFIGASFVGGVVSAIAMVWGY